MYCIVWVTVYEICTKVHDCKLHDFSELTIIENVSIWHNYVHLVLIEILFILTHYNTWVFYACIYIYFCFYSASERLLEMLGSVVGYVDDVLVSRLNSM